MAQLETCYYRGNLVKADNHAARLSSFLDAPGFKDFPGIFVISMGFVGINSWTLGRAASALEPITRAVAFGRSSESPYDLAMALFFESWLRQFLGEPQLVQQIGAQALAISEAHDIPYARNLAHCMTGGACFGRGRWQSRPTGSAGLRNLMPRSKQTRRK
jgi:hypothetical protein